MDGAKVQEKCTYQQCSALEAEKEYLPGAPLSPEKLLQHQQDKKAAGKRDISLIDADAQEQQQQAGKPSHQIFPLGKPNRHEDQQESQGIAGRCEHIAERSGFCGKHRDQCGKNRDQQRGADPKDPYQKAGCSREQQKAEQERLAQIRAEQERLRAAREAQLRAEQQQAAAARAKENAQARAAREAANAKAKAEYDRKMAEYNKRKAEYDAQVARQKKLDDFWKGK